MTTETFTDHPHDTTDGEQTGYAEVLAEVQENPVEYAKAVKAFKSGEGWTRYGLRKILRGLSATGEFPATDTSDKTVTVTRTIGRDALVDMADRTQAQAEHAVEPVSGKHPDDSILLGEMPTTTDTRGRSLAELTEEFMFYDQFSYNRIPADFSVEDHDLLKRYDEELREIRNRQNERRQFQRDNERTRLYSASFRSGLDTLNDEEIAGREEALSEQAIEDIRGIYLRMDAELAERGVEL